MQIESKIKRQGGTAITLPAGNGRNTSYLFINYPDDPEGPHVAEVVDADHIGILLAIKEGYRLAPGQKGAVEGAAETMLEVEAGESLTFMVIKSGHVLMDTLAAMGLELVDQRLGLPPSLEDDPAAPPVMRSLPPETPPTAPPPVPVAKTPWHEGVSDADLAAQVKMATGRAPKAGTSRDVMIAALEAAADDKKG